MNKGALPRILWLVVAAVSLGLLPRPAFAHWPYWGWGYPYGYYGYSPWYYAPSYPYYYPYSCPPGYTCTPNGNDDPPPSDQNPKSGSNPAKPWRPPVSTPNTNYGARTVARYSAGAPLGSSEGITAKPSSYRVTQSGKPQNQRLRPEVQHAIQSLARNAAVCAGAGNREGAVQPLLT